jgi:CHAT domain-containing protein
VKQALLPLIAADKLEFHTLNPPTFEEFQEQRNLINQVDILHFDGHGAFGKRCANRNCNAIAYAYLDFCPECGGSLRHVETSGFLVFEGRDRKGDPIATKDMVDDLSRSRVALAVLSACQSAVVRGDSVFGGVAPGFILAGVPAVIGIQTPAFAEHTRQFTEEFYRTIAYYQSLAGKVISDAVFRGRRKLFRDEAWHIPTLYLRERL